MQWGSWGQKESPAAWVCWCTEVTQPAPGSELFFSNPFCWPQFEVTFDFIFIGLQQPVPCSAGWELGSSWVAPKPSCSVENTGCLFTISMETPLKLPNSAGTTCEQSCYSRSALKVAKREKWFLFLCRDLVEINSQHFKGARLLPDVCRESVLVSVQGLIYFWFSSPSHLHLWFPAGVKALLWLQDPREIPNTNWTSWGLVSPCLPIANRASGNISHFALGNFILLNKVFSS